VLSQSFPTLCRYLLIDTWVIWVCWCLHHISHNTVYIVINSEIYPPDLALPPKNLTLQFLHQYLTAACVQAPRLWNINPVSGWVKEMCECAVSSMSHRTHRNTEPSNFWPLQLRQYLTDSHKIRFCDFWMLICVTLTYFSWDICAFSCRRLRGPQRPDPLAFHSPFLIMTRSNSPAPAIPLEVILPRIIVPPGWWHCQKLHLLS
jgi:hypothetical protein